MKLPIYLFASSPELPGAGIILNTSPPFYIGKIWLFKDRDEMAYFIATRMPEVSSKINGYRILIEGAGSLLENPTLSRGGQNTNTLAKIYKEMADFYLTYKIKPNASYYKRYQED